MVMECQLTKPIVVFACLVAQSCGLNVTVQNRASLVTERSLMVTADNLRGGSRAPADTPKPVTEEVPAELTKLEKDALNMEVAKLEKDAEDDVEGKNGTGPALLLPCTLIIGLIFAFVYKSKVVGSAPSLQPKQANSQGKDFPKGLFACFSHLHYCLHVSCCASCRVAHTWQVAGILDFWPSIMLMCCCGAWMSCINGFWARKKLREQLGMEEDSAMDCIKAFFCCSACMAGQDALAVDEATGVEVRCCCNLINLGDKLDGAAEIATAAA